MMTTEIKEAMTAKYKALAKTTRADWEHKGITARVCGVSEEAYAECIAYSVLAQLRQPVTDEAVNAVLAAMRS